MSDEVDTKSITEQPEATVNGTGSEATATNGSVEPPKEAIDAPLVQAAAPDDTTTAADTNDDVTASAAATPASAKSKRKSTSGVPEHKNKKLNRKKSMPNLNLDAKPGEYYWARWRGAKPWPAIVVAQDMLPPELLAKRPVGAQQEDGTYRADFQEGGKNAKDRQFPILFLGENNLTWIVNSALTKLDKEDCAGWEEKKLSKGLQEAHKVAMEAPGLEHFRGILNSAAEARMKIDIEMKEAELAHERALEEEAAAEAAKAAEPKAPKKPRKSKSAADADDMAIDTEAPDAAKPTKKRKKDAVSDGEQPAKKPAKVRLSTAKSANGTPAKRATKEKKTVEATEAEDQVADPAEAIRVAIMFLRHKLQKAFLSRDVPVSPDDMPNYADYLAQLEAVPELDSSIIRTTKIHKVLKGILKLPEIPRDAEFNFAKRCEALYKTWEDTLSKDSVPPSAIEPADGKTATTNGFSKSENKDSPAATNGTAAADDAAEATEKPEKADTTMAEAEAPVPAAPEATNGTTEDVTMADAKAEAKDEKIAPGSSEDKGEPAGDESSKTLQANAGEAAA